MSDLLQLKNIGKSIEKKLISIGIDSKEKLFEVGSRQAFVDLKQKYPNICLVHLYALEGAILDIELDKLPEKIKDDLKNFSDFLKK